MEVGAVTTWIATKIWWSVILKGLNTIGFKRIGKMFQDKIEMDVEIEDKGDIQFITEQPFPAAWLKFEVRSKSDFDLTPKNIAAWVYWGSVIIDKISWQESNFENTFPNNNIPKIPSKTDQHFTFYYPLPVHVDFGKYGLIMRGIIEFDSGMGRVTKRFNVIFDIPENKWNEALDKWKGKEEWKSKRTILNCLSQNKI